MKELFEKMDRAILKGCKCLIVSDDDYSVLQHEVWEREKILGILRDGSERFMIYHGVHVFSSSKTAMISEVEPDGRRDRQSDPAVVEHDHADDAG